MAKRKVELILVTAPVVSIQLNAHCRTNVYMVDAGEHFRLPDEGSKPQYASGPTLVIEHCKGQLEREYECYCIGDDKPWQWIGDLMRAGQWALTDKNVAPILPPELVNASPRFNGTSQRQRERMKDKLPPGGRRGKKRVQRKAK